MVTGERLRIAFKNAGIPLAKVADYIGISQTSLYSILKKDTFEIEYLKKAAELLGVSAGSLLYDAPPTIQNTEVTQTGDFNQAGHSNTQKVKINKAPDLAAELDQCHRDNEALKRELALANALVASKDETITLLRASYTRPS